MLLTQPINIRGTVIVDCKHTVSNLFNYSQLGTIHSGFGTKTRVRRKLAGVSSFVAVCSLWLGSTVISIPPGEICRQVYNNARWDSFLRGTYEKCRFCKQCNIRMFRSAKDSIRGEREKKNTSPGSRDDREVCWGKRSMSQNRRYIY